MQIAESLGLCFGLIVRSMGFAKGFTASFSALRSGEVSQYTEVLEDSRRHAVDRMIANAHVLGADAIIAVRFDSSEIGQEPHRDPRLRHRGEARAVTRTDAVAAELGRHYVAGHLEADELDERLGRLYAAPESAVALLEDLPGLEPAVPARVAGRKGWWRRRHSESDGARPDWIPTSERFLRPDHRPPDARLAGPADAHAALRARAPRLGAQLTGRPQRLKKAGGGSIEPAVVLQTAYMICTGGLSKIRNESVIPLVGVASRSTRRKSVSSKPAMPNDATSLQVSAGTASTLNPGAAVPTLRSALAPSIVSASRPDPDPSTS